jgi:hypothetical protein
MKSGTPVSAGDPLRDPQDFSLVVGGPLFQLMRWAHLSDDTLLLVRRRIVVIALVCWLPLLVLSALGGQLLDGNVTVPFLKDIEVHVRFLIAVPLLIGAEIVVHERMRNLVKVFLERHLIPESAMPRFDSAIASAFRLRNSVLAEVLLIAFVYAVGILFVWPNITALETATWYGTPSGDGSRLSPAGLWLIYVSLPIFQFLLIRWYFRFFIWARFLWQVSRIELRLVPTHPDRSGGLGFLSAMVHAFIPVLLAHGVLLAGNLANRIFYTGANLLDFKVEIIFFIIFLELVVTGPLLVFAPQLARAKRIGRREYGTLAERYVREFDAKWLRGGAAADEPLLGAADLQSLADLGNSLEVIQTMRASPVNKEALLLLAATIFAPIVPLALTIMPLEDLLDKLFGVLF